MRQQANQQSGWQAAGRVERLRSQALRPWWWWLLWRGQGRVERRGSPSARASPGARGGSAPLLDTLDVGGGPVQASRLPGVWNQRGWRAA